MESGDATTIIVPTITTDSYDVFRRQFALYAGRPVIHLDYSDGTLAPSRTLDLAGLDIADKVVLPSEDVSSDKPALHVHIMADNPLDVLDSAIALHPRVIYLHAESNLTAEQFSEAIDRITCSKIATGIAILQDSDPRDDRIKQILSNPRVHVGLIFGGKLGYQGGTADLSQLWKVAAIRAYRPDISFAWDGGANVENVDKIRDAGVRIINVGAAVARASDPLTELALLDEIATEDSHEIPLCNNCD